MRKEEKIPIELLRRLMRYEPETGHLYWLPRPEEMFENKALHRSWTNRFEGKRGFCGVWKVGYHASAIFGIGLYAHRVIWALVYGEWPNGQIDHIDGDKLNNRIENLRLVNNAENRLNLPLRKKTNSAYHGVWKIEETGKWRARIQYNGTSFHIGMFNTAEDAIAARKVAEAKFGFHPNHGRKNRRPA